VAVVTTTVTNVRTPDPSTTEELLVERAQTVDEDAFSQLVEAHRAAMHAHCYRMLGSFHDAEDALQDALLRAWRGISGFEGRSSVRSWLYKIATNSALDMAKKRRRRELPNDRSSPSRPGSQLDPPVTEVAWLEPYPDLGLPTEERFSPEARYDQRESLELAFVAALQHLPARQRAVLVLRDVMGFSASEVADQLDASPAAVTSALQRARAATKRRASVGSQKSTIRALGDERTRKLAERYADAIERGDAETLVSMLTEDAAWAMPPIPTWFRGQQAIVAFLTEDVFPERWRHRVTTANGQLAVAGYLFSEDKGRFCGAVIDVLTLEGDRIAAVTGFLTAEETDDDDRFSASSVFPRFGLPVEIEL
jgi:RNA polymerase sigma-70 factor, ECF subfamily